MSALNNLTVILIITLFAFIATSVAMPWAIKCALSHSMVDLPNDRKVHHGKIPRIGGMIFVPIALICSAIAILLLYNTQLPGACSTTRLALQLLAVALIFAAGTIDDIMGLRYRVKFVVQALAGALLCASGLYISNLHGILGIYEIPAFVGWAITIFAVIYCTNAMNFIDGLDGQASLIAMTAFAYYFIYMNRHGDSLYTLLCPVFLGALVAFFIFNVFGSAKRGTKTFMGDAGSQTLGLLIVMLGIACCNYNSISPEGLDGAFIRAFAPLFLPCMDVVRVTARRVRTGSNPFAADRNHFHHKLLDAGLTTGQVTATIATMNAVVIVLSVLLARYINCNLVIIIVLGIWTLLNVGITHDILKKQKKLHNEKSL